MIYDHKDRAQQSNHIAKSLVRKGLPDGRRRPGWPKTTLSRTVENKRQAAEWQLQVVVRALATNHIGWKENVEAICALWHG